MTTLKEIRARFARDQGLPFANTLSERSILETLDEHGVKYRARVFGPVTTIWGFLSQVLSEDHRCRDAVAENIAPRVVLGLETCSPNTAIYCNARGRLPIGVLVVWSGRHPLDQVGDANECPAVQGAGDGA